MSLVHYFGFHIEASITPSAHIQATARRACPRASACLSARLCRRPHRDNSVIFDNRVYDLTVAKRWDLTGHIGQHLCGKEYDREAIEEGSHNVGVMEKFFLTNICGSGAAQTVQPQTGWPKMILGMTWFRFSAYLSLLFFVFNFATCYAMPWASVKEPWKGSRPGKDKNDILGNFPLTHMHKIWAWLAIFALSFHGILGFVGVFFGKWL